MERFLEHPAHAKQIMPTTTSRMPSDIHNVPAPFKGRSPFHVDLASPVRSLAAGEKQKLEILKQLYLKSSIIILDEPTSVLTPAEADEVLGLLHEMARSGQVSLIDH